MVKSVIVCGESGVGGVPYPWVLHKCHRWGGVPGTAIGPQGHHRAGQGHRAGHARARAGPRATGQGMAPQGHHRATGPPQGIGQALQGRAWHRARAMTQPSDGPLAGTTGSVRGTDVFFSINDI